MPPFVDARVPVRFGSVSEAAGHDWALLIEGDTPAPDGVPVARFTGAAPVSQHPPGCPCCTARSPPAMALAALFLARARGEVEFLRTAVAACCTPGGEAAVRSALQLDPFSLSQVSRRSAAEKTLSARFKPSQRSFSLSFSPIAQPVF